MQSTRFIEVRKKLLTFDIYSDKLCRFQKLHKYKNVKFNIYQLLQGAQLMGQPERSKPVDITLL